MESESWDFYFTEIVDLPASIYVDFKYESSDERRDHDTLAVIKITMLDPDRHGMGSAAEAAALWPFEDQITAAASDRFIWVGRRRGAGVWELVFYGGTGLPELLKPIIQGLDRDKRAARLLHKSDPEWQYYEDILLPDPERRQWMRDRDLVHSLQQQGDELKAKREVDHFAYFRTATARDAFAADAAKAGFRLEVASEDSGQGSAFVAHIARSDRVDLENIHDVVMTLVALAEQHGGSYDGWGTAIVQPKSKWRRRRS